MRRKDPLKRAAILGGVIVFAGVAACLYFQFQVSRVQGVLQVKKDELAGIEKTSKVVGENFKKIGEIDEKVKALREMAVNRALWGPVLNSLQTVMADLTSQTPGAPCPVTLLKFRVGQRYDYEPGKKAVPPAKSKPGTSTERILLSIEGRDYGTEQEQNYNLLKEKLAVDPYLKEQLRKDNPVKLQSYTERQIDAADPSKSFLNFVLEANYPERVR